MQKTGTDKPLDARNELLRKNQVDISELILEVIDYLTEELVQAIDDGRNDAARLAFLTLRGLRNAPHGFGGYVEDTLAACHLPWAAIELLDAKGGQE